MAFAKATRKQAHLRLALSGPSGAGKTYTALAIAQGLKGDKRVAVIDTESGSASLYANQFDFDVLEIAAPYHPDKFIAALKDAADSGYGVVVVDSITHEWAAPGGIMSLVDDEVKKQKTANTFSAWKGPSALHDKFIVALKTTPINLIATMRSKTEYLQADRKVQKVGMAPVQREGMEYEFDIMMDLTIEHFAYVTKTRAAQLDSRGFDKPGAELGAEILAWLNSGEAPKPAPPPGEDESWAADKMQFAADCEAAGLDADQVSTFWVSVSKPEAKAMHPNQRAALLKYTIGAGRVKFDAWLETQGKEPCKSCGCVNWKEKSEIDCSECGIDTAFFADKKDGE